MDLESISGVLSLQISIRFRLARANKTRPRRSNGVLRTTGGTDGYAGAALRLQGAGPAEFTDIVDSDCDHT